MTQINKYLTVIVRDDLSTGYKVPQSIHSVVEFSITHNDEYKNWKSVNTERYLGFEYTIFR